MLNLVLDAKHLRSEHLLQVLGDLQGSHWRCHDLVVQLESDGLLLLQAEAVGHCHRGQEAGAA